MQRSVNNLIGYSIIAKDGELGIVNEFYFDDLTWSIRYLVVNTGNWLFQRKVLIPHAALGMTDWKSGKFQVNLTVDQVRNSPDIETERTVTRQHEIELFSHYGFPVYWGNTFYDGPIGMIPVAPLSDMKTAKGNDDSVQKLGGESHLRSTKNVKGYHIHANDGEIGHVEDYIVDDEKWNLCFMIVDTKNWLSGRKVLISPRWINRIEWGELKVYVNLSQESIKNSPEFDITKLIDKDYERELFNHYGKHINQLD